MRLLILRLLPVVALLSFPFIARAATYYVAPSGSDSNACTSASAPCRTIGHAAGLAKSPGDIVQVAAGVYAESPTLGSSGAAGNPITFRGQDGSGCPAVAVNDVNHPTGSRPASQAVVTGAITLAGNYLAINCFHLKGNSGIQIQPGVSNSSITQNEIEGTGSTGDGISFQGIASVQSSQYAKAFTIDRNYIHGTSTGIFLVCSSCMVTN
ncbi:MAG: hypothetical protein JWP08_2395, partial [Bryobacterales bacterium]|nr:hypothetical protein [Bryobacterales bacterium]